MPRAFQAISFDSLMERLSDWLRFAGRSVRLRFGLLRPGSRIARACAAPRESHAGKSGDWPMASTEACLASLDEMKALDDVARRVDSPLADDLVNIPGFAEQFASRHAAEANAHAVRMVVDVPPDALVIGDASGLHRTIDSFLVNALANTPEGGCLTIRGNVAQGFVTLTALCTQQTMRTAETPRGNLCLSLSLPVA